MVDSISFFWSIGRLFLGVLQAVVMEDMGSRACHYFDTLALCTMKITVHSTGIPLTFPVTDLRADMLYGFNGWTCILLLESI
jgi:hypothetical protein